MALLKNRKPIRVQSFNRGQFSAGEPTTVPENAASGLNNLLINELGQAEQRGGLTRQGDNPDALVSHWTFDDSSSVDDKGSNDGTDTDIIYVDGKFGKAAEFNGASSKIVVAADSTIDVDTIGSLTVSAFVNPNTDGENDVGRIVDKTDDRATPTLGYVLNIQEESTGTFKIRFFVKYDGAADAEVITSTTIATDTLTKIEAVLNADDSIDIFINGVKASYGTDTSGVGSPVDDSGQDLVIGNNDGDDATFDGIIDDVRIYNTPRAAADVQLSKVWGLTRFRVAGTIDKLYRIIGASLQGLDADFKAWSDIDTGFTTGKETNFVKGRASDGTFRLFIGNATDNVHSMTTGEAVTDEGNTNADPPRTAQFEWHDNRLFAIDADGNINYSDILDGQTFDRTVNKFRLKNKAKAIKSFKEKELIVYLTKGIQVLNTTGAIPLTDWVLNLFNEEAEFNSPRTVANAGDDQIFLAKDGVRLLSRTQFDTTQSGLISQPIQDVIDSINVDAIDKAVGKFVNNRYILAIPTGTSSDNNTVVIWDSLAARIANDLRNGWTVIPAGTWTPSMFEEFEFGDNEISLVAGDNRALSLVYQALGDSVNTDNGATIVSEIISIDHTIDRVSDAIWDPIQIVAQSGVATTIQVLLEVNRTGFTAINTLALTGSAPVLPIALEFNLGGTARARGLFRSKLVGRGRTCRVKILHNTYNKRPTFVEYTLFARTLNPRFT